MNIGDRVRMLHSNEEGVISKISSGGRIEIEIEEGFRIPAMKNEIVIISPVEEKYFGKTSSETFDDLGTSNRNISDFDEGIYLAYLPINDREYLPYILNNSGENYLCVINEIFGDNAKTIFSERLSAKTSKKLAPKNPQDFESWPPLELIFYPINEQISKRERAFERKLKFKASSFFKSKKAIPLIGKNGYLFKISEQTQEIDSKTFLDAILEPKVEDQKPRIPRPDKEIDLHIEELVKDHSFMSNAEILRLQMDTFDKALNQAIASGMDEITFIHGIGNGVLRKEIHKYLSQLGNIKYFQDKQKSPFGYGATLVRIS